MGQIGYGVQYDTGCITIHGQTQTGERTRAMILEASIKDLVDTIEHQLKRMAYAEDIIEERHRLQPPALAYFNDQIRRLRDILDSHIAPILRGKEHDS